MSTKTVLAHYHVLFTNISGANQYITVPIPLGFLGDAFLLKMSVKVIVVVVSSFVCDTTIKQQFIFFIVTLLYVLFLHLSVQP